MFIDVCPDYRYESDVNEGILNGFILINGQGVIEERYEYIKNVFKLSKTMKIQADKKGVTIPDCLPTWAIYAKTRKNGRSPDLSIIMTVSSVLNN